MAPDLVAPGSVVSYFRRTSSIDVLNTRAFRRAFFRSLSRDIDKMTIVSPFVTPLPDFDTTYRFFSFLVGRMPDSSFVLVTKPPNDTRNNVLSWQEANLIANLGVSVVVRPERLHSKVYYLRYPEGDSSSFVGSANFTKGGFKKNDESIAYWRSPDRDEAMERELARLTGRGSYTLMQWTIKEKQHHIIEEAFDET